MGAPDPHHHHHHQGEEEQQQQPPAIPQYGTFAYQGVANYPPQPVIGFPQPVPPPGFSPSSSSGGQPYLHGYQAVPGYAVAEGRPFIRERRLPCCGLGMGWVLFIIGFLFGAVPWYLGAIVLLCARIDHREKPGYLACMIAAILVTFAMAFGLSKNDW